MNELALRIYHRLPSPLRSSVATVRGYQLRTWRYGPEFERLVEEAREREQWSKEDWQAWRGKRLAYVLHQAATQVPYYREQWAARRAKGDRSSWEDLDAWPLLDKEELRAQPRAFVADDRNVRSMFHEHTSGTTGKPLDLWWSRETVQAWYALWEARIRRWNGVSRSDRWAILGGQPVVKADARKPPYWVWNAAMHQLYLSANHVSPRNAAAFVGSLREYRITHLVGYPSSVAALADETGALAPLPELRLVIANAEPLLPRQREVIERSFGCRAVETYGMGEIVAAGSECSAGHLHMWPEVGHVEVVDDDCPNPALPGQTGRLICTGLLNEDMPLIRYLVGDRGNVQQTKDRCLCGRTLPAFCGLEGRSADMLIARDGRRVFWLNPVFYGLPIREAQIVQDSVEQVRVRYVPADGYSAADGQSIVERVQARMGAIDVHLEAVTQIPRGANGKFRSVICNVPAKASEQSGTTIG